MVGSHFLPLGRFLSVPCHCSPCSSHDVCKEQLVKWQINLIPFRGKNKSGILLLVFAVMAVSIRQ